ncbi:MAG: DUF4293 domain-containing protein [Chitinophagales bacterium]|nr:DUF4293 domain-containing protein [Chitinophagales bacterium]
MLQRLQTVYLLLSLGCIVLLLFFPVWQTTRGYSAEGLNTVGAGTHIFLMPVAAILVFSHLVAIFLFKNRKRQLQFCTGNILLFIIYLIWALIIIQTESHIFQNFNIAEFKTGAYLPLIGMILNILARIGILKDEALIRSMNRLR